MFFRRSREVVCAKCGRIPEYFDTCEYDHCIQVDRRMSKPLPPPLPVPPPSRRDSDDEGDEISIGGRVGGFFGRFRFRK